MRLLAVSVALAITRWLASSFRFSRSRMATPEFAVHSTTVEFLPFGLDWIHVAEIRFSENKGLPNNNDPPRQQKVRNSTVEIDTRWELTRHFRELGWLRRCMFFSPVYLGTARGPRAGPRRKEI